MGNIDCRNMAGNDQADQLELYDKICIRIGSVGTKLTKVNGDHDQIDPETKRNQENNSPGVLRNGTKLTKLTNPRKIKNTIKSTEVEQFMNELVDDNNYSQKQMNRLRRSSFVNTSSKASQKFQKSMINYQASHEFERMLSEQEKFLEDKKDQIEQQMKFKEFQRTRVLKPSNRSKCASRIISELDTIIKREDEKQPTNTETSNLMQLISHLQKLENKSDVNKSRVLTEIERNNEQIFQIEIFLDNTPCILHARRDDDLNDLIRNFIQEHQLPNHFQDKLVEGIQSIIPNA